MLSTEQELELLDSLQKIADSLSIIAWDYHRRYEKEYPEKPGVREALVTKIPDDEEALREAQGQSGEPIEEWVGIHEKQFLDEKD